MEQQQQQQPRKKRQAAIKKKEKGPFVYSKKSIRIQNSCLKTALLNTTRDTDTKPL